METEIKEQNRIIAIGDIHGRNCWKSILAENLSTIKRIVFVGDYFDSRDGISQIEQLFNFQEILNFKKDNPEKVILLIGNHDFHYMGNFNITYSGFNAGRAFDIREILQNALKEGLIQASHLERTDMVDILFTHAGVTNTWCQENEIDLSNISHAINELFIHQPRKFEFTPGESFNNYGDEICQTPIWIRPSSLIKDGVLKNEILQVVGHTQQKAIKSIDRFIFIDVLSTMPDEFLCLTF